eukprot:scaffold8023_cov103-Isochrysis_galbana.AAC.11
MQQELHAGRGLANAHDRRRRTKAVPTQQRHFVLLAHIQRALWAGDRGPSLGHDRLEAAVPDLEWQALSNGRVVGRAQEERQLAHGPLNRQLHVHRHRPHRKVDRPAAQHGRAEHPQGVVLAHVQAGLLGGQVHLVALARRASVHERAALGVQHLEKDVSRQLERRRPRHLLRRRAGAHELALRGQHRRRRQRAQDVDLASKERAVWKRHARCLAGLKRLRRANHSAALLVLDLVRHPGRQPEPVSPSGVGTRRLGRRGRPEDDGSVGARPGEAQVHPHRMFAHGELGGGVREPRRGQSGQHVRLIDQQRVLAEELGSGAGQRDGRHDGGTSRLVRQLQPHAGGDGHRGVGGRQVDRDAPRRPRH